MREVPSLAIFGTEGRLTDEAITALARLLLMTELPHLTVPSSYIAQHTAPVGDFACHEPPYTSA